MLVHDGYFGKLSYTTTFLYLAHIEEVVAQVATKWLNHCPPNL
jgi:hypothetical protein